MKLEKEISSVSNAQRCYATTMNALKCFIMLLCCVSLCIFSLFSSLTKEQLAELWKTLQRTDTKTLGSFEEFLLNITNEIKRAKLETVHLENTLKRWAHLSNLMSLYVVTWMPKIPLSNRNTSLLDFHYCICHIKWTTVVGDCSYSETVNLTNYKILSFLFTPAGIT